MKLFGSWWLSRRFGSVGLMGMLTFLFVVTAFSVAAPQPAQAQGSCTINWGTVAYRSANNTYVMSESVNPAVLAACDPRFPNVDSGPVSPLSGSSNGGGTWSAVANLADNTLTYSPNARWVGPDTYTMYFCNDAGCTGAGRLTATVNITVAPPLMSMTQSIPGGTVATAYSQTLTANGGASPYTFSVVSGSLPPGLSLGTVSSPTSSSSNVVLSGTPTAGGTFNFTIRATDNSIGTGPLTIDQSYTMTIGQPTVMVTTASVPNGTQNSAYASTTLSATGGTAPYTWSVLTGSLPTGVTLSSGGVLSGTPTQGGSFTFTARAQDSSTGTGPYIGTRAYSFNIVAVTPVANPVSVTVPYASVNNPVPLNITGSAPTSVSIGTQAINGVASVSGTTITYTPIPGYGGTDTFTYRATNASGTSAPATVTVTVSPPTITLNPATLANGKRTVAYSQTLTGGGGVGPYIYTHAGGTLPPGVNLNNITGQVSGTPTTNGTYNFTIRVEDASSYGAGAPFFTTRAYTVSIVEPTPPIAGTVSATVAYGSNNNPITLNLSGGAATSVAIGTNATNGAAFASGTSVIYTPAPGYSGPDSFSYTATNADGTSAPATVTITVNPQPPTAGAVSTTVAFDSFDNPVSLVLGGGAATSVAIPVLPTNGVVTVTGISVTYTPDPGYAGSDSFTYVAANAGGPSAPATVSVTVTAPTIVVAPASLPDAQTATVYSQTVTASGGIGGYSYAITAGALPNGLTLSAGGVISGTTTAGGAYGFTITATDSRGFTGNQAYTVAIINPVITITAPAAGALPGVAAGDSYSQTFTATGGQTPHTFAVTAGALPAGLTLSGQGVLSGTPTVSGTFNFTVTASDGSLVPGPFTAAQAYSLTVTAPTITVSPTSVPAAAAASSYNHTFTAAGGIGSYSFAVTAGVLPPGLNLDPSGLLTGAPGASGVFAFTVTATDSLGFTGARAYSLAVDDPIIVLTGPAGGALPAGAGGAAYSQTFTATGGQGAHSFVVASGALPAGLTLSSGGVLSGTPTASGSFAFSVEARDASPAPGPFVSAAVAYTLQISAPSIALTPAAGALPDGPRTVAYSQTLTASGGTGPYSFTVTAGALPVGLTLAANGALTGTPTTAGSNSFTVTATDALGFTGAAAYTLEIGTPAPVVQPQTATVVGGQSVTLDVTQGAAGVDFTSVSVASAPAHGTAVVQGLTIVYTADGAFSGTDSFTYTVNNDGGSSAPATVTITVNSSVVAGPVKTATVLAGQTATVELTHGATGSPFTGAAVVSVGPSGAGTAIITPRTDAGGIQLYDLVFTPDDAFTGEATVLYTLSNAFATSAPGTVIITVEARPDPGLDPEVRGVASSQVTAAKRFADAQINNFQRRLQALRHGTNGSSNGLSLNLGFGGQSDLDNDPREALRRQMGQSLHSLDPGALNDGRDREMLGLDLWAGRTPTGTGPAASAIPDGDRLSAVPTSGQQGGRSVGFWTAGSVDWGRQDAEGQRDNRFTTQGVSAGLDVRINDQLIVGGGLGYGEDKTRIGEKGSLTEGSALTGALYASWRPAEALYIDGVIGVADLDFDSRRWVEGLGGQPSGYAEGRRSGDVGFASAAFGRMIRREGWTSDFYARLDAREMTLDGFTETGGGMSALTWDALDQSSLSANLGASLRWSVDSRRYGQVTPSARVEWSHELEDIGLQGVRYADWAASPTYLVPLDDWSRNALNLDLGVEWSLSERLTFSLGYRAMLGDASSSQGGQIGLKYGW